MAVWLLQDMGNAIKFTTAGGTGEGGAACFGGPAEFDTSTSYYANGGVNIYFGSTRGLVNLAKFGNANVAAAAGCGITNYAHQAALGTSGATLDLTYEFIKPTASFGYVGFWRTMGDYNRIEVGIRNGIIYKWKDWSGRRVPNQWNYPYPATLTAGLSLEVSAGVKVTDHGGAVAVGAGISATVSYQVIYDLYFPNGYYTTAYYKTVTIAIQSGLIQSVTVAPAVASIPVTILPRSW